MPIIGPSRASIAVGNRAPRWPFCINQDSPQAQGLVGWWPWPGLGLSNVRELSGRDANGTGTGLDIAVGPFGAQVFGFGSSQDRINVASGMPAKGGGSGNDFMLSAWVVPANVTNTMAISTFQQNSGATVDVDFANVGISGAAAGDPLTVQWRSIVTDNATARTSGGFSVGKASHAAGLFTGLNASLEARAWLDGELTAGNNFTSPSSSTDDNAQTYMYWGLRRRNGNYEQQFLGQMWDMRLYETHDPEIIRQAYDPATRWDLYHELGRRTFFLPAAGGGTTVSAGLASETDTALAVAATKAKAAGLASETDSALAVGVRRSYGAGLPSELDTALAVAHAKAKAVGLASEADTALAAVARRSYAVGLAQETSSAFGVTWTKSKAVGLATETDQALGATVAGGVVPEPEEAAARGGMMVDPGRLMNR